MPAFSNPYGNLNSASGQGLPPTPVIGQRAASNYSLRTNTSKNGEFCLPIGTNNSKNGDVYLGKRALSQISLESTNTIKSLNVFALTLKGIKAKQIIKIVNSFYGCLSQVLPQAKLNDFLHLIHGMFKFLEDNQERFKKNQSDSLAACMLLLVCSHLEVSKK